MKRSEKAEKMYKMKNAGERLFPDATERDI